MEINAAELLRLIYVIVFFVNITRTVADSHSSLLKLIELHDGHCNTPSLCTYRSATKESPSQKPTCCQTCSCETECTEQGTCCPDYHLIDLIGTEVSTNISHFSKRLQNVDFAPDTRKQSACIEVRESYLARTDRKITQNIINSCPAQFQGGLDISMKCEEPRNNSTFQSDLFVPATLRNSFITYSNIYCLFCNEKEDSFMIIELWKTIIYCRGRQHVNFIEVTPLDFMKAYFQTETGKKNCRIEFSPSIPKELDDNCDAVDFETCPEGSDKELDDLCRFFHLPVNYPVNEVKGQRYRNIACYLCRSDKQLTPKCEIDNTEEFEYGFAINVSFNVNRNREFTAIDKTENLVPLNVRVSRYGCSHGFIRITSSDGKPECKRVLCPLNFFPLDGQCYTAFNELYRTYFTAILDVRRLQEFGQEMINEIRITYKKTILRSASRLFSKFTWGIWEMDNTHDIVMVSFTTALGALSYEQVLNNFALFLNSICTASVITDSTATEVSITLNRNPKISWSSFSTLTPKPKLIRAYKELNSTLTMVELFNTHLCYRVAVPISEKNYYTKNRLVEESIQYTRSGQMKVCVDDVYRNISSIGSAYMFASACAKATVEFMKKMPDLKDTVEVSSNNSSKNDDDNNNKKNKIKKKKIKISIDKSLEDDIISDSVKSLLVVGLPIAAIVVAVAVANLRKQKQKTEDVEQTDEETRPKDYT